MDFTAHAAEFTGVEVAFEHRIWEKHFRQFKDAVAQLFSIVQDFWKSLPACDLLEEFYSSRVASNDNSSFSFRCGDLFAAVTCIERALSQWDDGYMRHEMLEPLRPQELASLAATVAQAVKESHALVQVPLCKLQAAGNLQPSISQLSGVISRLEDIQAGIHRLVPEVLQHQQVIILLLSEVDAIAAF
jgi:hypothetical protein